MFIACVRLKFRQIRKRVKNNPERFVVDQNGELDAVIMSLADYVDVLAPTPHWLNHR